MVWYDMISLFKKQLLIKDFANVWCLFGCVFCIDWKAWFLESGKKQSCTDCSVHDWMTFLAKDRLDTPFKKFKTFHWQRLLKPWLRLWIVWKNWLWLAIYINLSPFGVVHMDPNKTTKCDEFAVDNIDCSKSPFSLFQMAWKICSERPWRPMFLSKQISSPCGNTLVSHMDSWFVTATNSGQRADFPK